MINIKAEIVRIPKWEHTGGIHNVIKFTYMKGEVVKFVDVAKKLSKSVPDQDPSGVPRTSHQKFCRALCGIIAENACSIAINKTAEKNRKTIKLSVKGFESSLRQIDLTLERNSRNFDIEIRSSGHFKQNLEEVYNRDFSIIGWYVTSKKRKEIKKDFYVLVLFPFLEDTIDKKIESGIELYIAGGATRETLEFMGSDTDLKQYGAIYHVISPITKGLDGLEIINKIVGVGDKRILGDDCASF